jgi:hypothetical protein
MGSRFSNIKNSQFIWLTRQFVIAGKAKNCTIVDACQGLNVEAAKKTKDYGSGLSLVDALWQDLWLE